FRSRVAEDRNEDRDGTTNQCWDESLLVILRHSGEINILQVWNITLLVAEDRTEDGDSATNQCRDESFLILITHVGKNVVARNLALVVTAGEFANERWNKRSRKSSDGRPDSLLIFIRHS